MLGQNGIIERTKEAVEKYKKSSKNETEVLTELGKKLENLNIDYNDYIGCYVEGYTPTEKTYTITSDVSGIDSNKDKNGNIYENIDENNEQKFTTETDMKWRIWDYDGTTIRLISEKPTNAKLTLDGATGYNNGVWIVNEICRQCYGQYDGNKMKTGIKLNNLKRSDIEKVTKYDYTQCVQLGESDVKYYMYGDTKNYSGNNNCPKIWIEFDQKWKYKRECNGNIIGEEEKEGLIWEEEGNGKYNGSEQSSNVTFVQSFWRYDYTKENAENEWVNEKYYDILFEGIEKEMTYGGNWLATRSTILGRLRSNFDLQIVQRADEKKEGKTVEKTRVYAGGLFNSDR